MASASRWEGLMSDTKQPIIIWWGGKKYEFSSQEEARKAGFHLEKLSDTPPGKIQQKDLEGK